MFAHNIKIIYPLLSILYSTSIHYVHVSAAPQLPSCHCEVFSQELMRALCVILGPEDSHVSIIISMGRSLYHYIGLIYMVATSILRSCNSHWLQYTGEYNMANGFMGNSHWILIGIVMNILELTWLRGIVIKNGIPCSRIMIIRQSEFSYRYIGKPPSCLLIIKLVGIILAQKICKKYPTVGFWTLLTFCWPSPVVGGDCKWENLLVGGRDWQSPGLPTSTNHLRYVK